MNERLRPTFIEVCGEEVRRSYLEQALSAYSKTPRRLGSQRLGLKTIEIDGNIFDLTSSPRKGSFVAEAFASLNREKGGFVPDKKAPVEDLLTQAARCAVLAEYIRHQLASAAAQKSRDTTLARYGVSFYKEIGSQGLESQKTARAARQVKIAPRKPRLIGIIDYGTHVEPVMKVEPNGKMTIFGPNRPNHRVTLPVVVPPPASEELPLVKPLRPENPFLAESKQKPPKKFPSLKKRFKKGVKLALGCMMLATLTIAGAIFAKPRTVSAAPSETAQNNTEEVPVMSQEDFMKWSSRFPQATLQALSNLVTLNKGIFDGGVATEMTYLQKRLAALYGYNLSLSPDMVNGLYGEYEAECENDPGRPWQISANQAVISYGDKIKAAISEVDLSKIQPPVQLSAQPQVKTPTPDSTESTKPETSKITDFGDRIPNPDFSKILKHSVILDNQEDFLQILVLQGFNTEEIEKFKDLLKFGTQMFPYSKAYNILDILQEAAKRKLSLSATQVIAGLESIDKNNRSLSSLDATELYLYLLQNKIK